MFRFFIFLLTAISLPAFAVTKEKPVDFFKLTGKGLVQIHIQPTPQSEDPKSDKTISALQVQRTALPPTDPNLLQLQNKSALKIVVLGDSGCRLKEGHFQNTYQDCADPKAWPFPKLMKQVAKEHPDLILHLGDYHYRENCSAGKPCVKMSGASGYGWKPWDLDFFQPAQVAFGKIPWVLVRGNHEDCDRAFLGYGKLIATPEFGETCTDYEEPDYITLKDLLIVNFDSSAVGEKIDNDTHNAEIWNHRFAEISQHIDALMKERKIKNVWLVTHKPFFGFVKMGPLAAPVNINLKKYLDASPLKDKVQLVMAGHIHISQVIKPMSGPLQMILGNGGTQLDTFSDFIEKTDPKYLQVQSIRTESPGFGYAVFERQAPASTDSSKPAWNVSFKNQDGKLTSSCNLDLEKQICTQTP